MPGLAVQRTRDRWLVWSTRLDALDASVECTALVSLFFWLRLHCFLQYV